MPERKQGKDIKDSELGRQEVFSTNYQGVERKRNADEKIKRRTR